MSKGLDRVHFVLLAIPFFIITIIIALPNSSLTGLSIYIIPSYGDTCYPDPDQPSLECHDESQVASKSSPVGKSNQVIEFPETKISEECIPDPDIPSSCPSSNSDNEGGQEELTKTTKDPKTNINEDNDNIGNQEKCIPDPDNPSSCDITPENQSPIANAGPDITISEEKSSKLDGSKSYDPDGTIESYQWSLEDSDEECPSASLKDGDSATPIVIASSDVTRDCSFLFELSVTDNKDLTDIDTMRVVVTNPISGSNIGSNSTNTSTFPNEQLYEHGTRVGDSFDFATIDCDNLAVARLDAGSISIKKVYLDNLDNSSNTKFRITPNPYNLSGSLILDDNDAVLDCDDTSGILTIYPLRFGSYTIEEVDSQERTTIHSFPISVHKSHPYPIVNIVEKNLNSSILLQNNLIANQLIVTLDQNITNDPRDIADQLVSTEEGIEVLHIYEQAIKGFALRVPVEKAKLIEQKILLDPRTSSVEQDQIGHIASSFMNQTLPTGVKRVDEDITNFIGLTRRSSGASGVDSVSSNTLNQRRITDINSDIAIIDTGVSLSHPDLNVYRNVSFVQGTGSGDDDQGHGSHVAGIAAAKDNSFGVVGMAPGARIWAIKVCDKMGSCPISDQIQGVEYVTEHSDQIDVANISIENLYSAALNEAINRSIAAGVTYVVAAGNSARDAVTGSPSAVSDAITVSAISDSDGRCGGVGRATIGGQDDAFGNFSNFGAIVDIAAPGADILSTYNGTEYGLDTGTSMASPHVAGAATLYKQAHPLASPSEVHDWLINSGSAPTTECDGRSYGYFTGDRDLYAEPVLYMRGLVSELESYEKADANKNLVPRGINFELIGNLAPERTLDYGDSTVLPDGNTSSLNGLDNDARTTDSHVEGDVPKGLLSR